MTKAELVSKIADGTGLDKREVLKAVESLMDVIKGSLENGENVYLRGFGTFQLKKRAEKIGRNISKNTSIVIPEHNIPQFKPANEFKDSLLK